MQHLTLIKENDRPRLNHLYEHLYCMELGRELRKYGFYNYTDYRVEARNYHVGFIYVTAIFYNPDITTRLDFAKVKPAFARSDIRLAIMQISAEHDTRSKYNEDKVITDLKELDAKPWENTENARSYNWRHTKPRHYPALSMHPIAPSNFRNMTCKMTLDQKYALNNEHLLPLFQELSNAILYNLSDLFTDTYGYFGHDSDSTYNLSETSEFHTFRIHHKDMLSAENLLEIAKEYAAKALSNGLERSLHNYLQLITNPQNYYYNEADTFETTGVLVGNKGWDGLNGVNIDEILEHCSITIKTGKVSKTSRMK